MRRGREEEERKGRGERREVGWESKGV